MTDKSCGECNEKEPIKVNAELEVKATAALDEEVDAELEAEDASLSELLDEGMEE